MKNLPAITAEIEKEFYLEFSRGKIASLSYVNLQKEFQDFLRAALLKVAEETVEAVNAGEYPNGFVEKQSHTGYYARGWNAAVEEMNSNFKTFININQ